MVTLASEKKKNENAYHNLQCVEEPQVPQYIVLKRDAWHGNFEATRLVGWYLWFSNCIDSHWRRRGAPEKNYNFHTTSAWSFT